MDMISVYNIWTVARVEIKTLLRSWFFRIFSGLVIAFLIFFDLMALTDVAHSPYMFRGIPASIPYMNLLLLNAVQAVIAVFLSSDFLKRDKKLNSTEVVYMRSMTNGDYVLGKTIGILIVFIVLNIIVLLIAAIYNFFFSDVPVVFPAYFFYPLFISIPTLIYILGLSFLFMAIVRNQAVTFILLLGYIATTLFFLRSKFHYIFDYLAYNVPLMYSDFVGFGNMSKILIHRGIYLFLGISFICLTIVFIRRLPQSKLMTHCARIGAVLFLAGAVVLVHTYLTRISAGESLRQQMCELNNELIGAPNVSQTACELDLVHLENEIECRATVTLENMTGRHIDRYIISLNPGLEVIDISNRNNRLTFDRNLHLVTIAPPHPLAPGDRDSLTITYRGKIDERACYLDIDDEGREKIYRAWLYNIDKRYSFITPRYMLLTPENLWYPVAGVQYSSLHPEYRPTDFITFKLRVKTNKQLCAISQGKVTELEDGDYIYTPEVPLPGISLAAGQYDQRSTVVDSITYNLFILKDHDYFSPSFNEIGDTLSVLIRELKQDFERKLELTYAYPRLTLIEVPIQFFAYRRMWTTNQENVQPEIVFLPEKGILVRSADFKRIMHNAERRSERRNEVFTLREAQSRVFTRFVTSTLASGVGGDRSRREGMYSYPTNYNIFPNCFTFTNHIRSKKWPILNVGLESFLMNRLESSSTPFGRFFSGLTPTEKTNIALTEHTLQEILTDPDKRDIAYDAIRMKGAHLFTMLQSKIGADAFNDLLTRILERSRFHRFDVEHFIEALKSEYQLDFEPYIESVYHSSSLPGFIIDGIESYQVLDNERIRFQVRFIVSNTEPVDGLILVAISTMDRGRPRLFRMGSDETELERLIGVQANQTKEIGFVLDDTPRIMSVNTLVSRNLPSTLDISFEDLELDEKTVPFEGERILDNPITTSAQHEIVIDNEDPEFEILNPPSTGFLRNILRRSSREDQEKYVGIRAWRVSRRWLATIHSDFYGKYVRSAHYTKAGKGDTKVAWNADIHESGYYDLYCFTSKVRSPWGRRRGSDFGHYHYLVHHDDGVDDASLDINNAQEGWNFLGTYYLSAGTTKVELTNESTGRLVFADAVKWVRQ